MERGESLNRPVVLPRRHPAVEVAEFETEIVVLEPRTEQVHLLGPLASLVFDACDGSTTVDELVAEIADWTSDDRASIEAAVATTLRELGGLGMLEGIEPAPPPPCVGCSRPAEIAAPRGRSFWRRPAREQRRR